MTSKTPSPRPEVPGNPIGERSASKGSLDNTKIGMSPWNGSSEENLAASPCGANGRQSDPFPRRRHTHFFPRAATIFTARSLSVQVPVGV